MSSFCVRDCNGILFNCHSELVEELTNKKIQRKARPEGDAQIKVIKKVEIYRNKI